MVLNPSNSSSLHQLALKQLTKAGTCLVVSEMHRHSFVAIGLDVVA